MQLLPCDLNVIISRPPTMYYCYLFGLVYKINEERRPQNEAFRERLVRRSGPPEDFAKTMRSFEGSIDSLFCFK